MRRHALAFGRVEPELLEPETRERRVDACAKVILAGRGFNERD